MAIVYLCVALAVICFVLFVLTVDSIVTSFFAIPLLFFACALLSSLAAVTVLQRLQLDEERRIKEEQQSIIRKIVETNDFREAYLFALENNIKERNNENEVLKR